MKHYSQRRKQKFAKRCIVGKGSFGTVWLVRGIGKNNKYKGNDIVMKVSNNSVQNCKSELKILQRLQTTRYHAFWL